MLTGLTRPVRLAYGTDGLVVDLPADATVLTPTDLAALADEAGEVRLAVRNALPSEAVSDGPVAVVFPDLTRPFPARTVLPALLDVLAGYGVADDRVRLLCATGTHRQATDAEMRDLIGDDLVDRYQVHDHDSTDTAAHETVGVVDGVPVRIDRAYLECTTRIVTGFVEPHFFAGFSGGPKAVCPGLAELSTVLEAHSPTRIAAPRATWTVLDGNPVQDFVRRAVELAPPTLSVDVAINAARQVTAVFAGTLPGSHRQACAFVERTSVLHVDEPFDVVVTTNAGHPLDRNLYQAVKGMTAAERIVRDGGTIVCAAPCGDGVPDDGGFGRLLAAARTVDDLLAPPSTHDQWQVQILGRILARARVGLFADGLSDEQIRGALLDPVADVGALVAERLAAIGPGARCCVLPEGPLTVVSLAA
ncbi:MAG TPA: nickel-dependent lactate racemase [Frankiaceae bacterium]|nr:nickel-dependent lactate racemase [Frankiaceae bacterium]